MIAEDGRRAPRSGRLLVWRAGWLKNHGAPQHARDVASRSGTRPSTRSRRALDAIQIHGANGYSNEFPVERYLRNSKAAVIYEGTSQLHTLIQADYAARLPRGTGRCRCEPWAGARAGRADRDATGVRRRRSRCAADDRPPAGTRSLGAVIDGIARRRSSGSAAGDGSWPAPRGGAVRRRAAVAVGRRVALSRRPRAAAPDAASASSGCVLAADGARGRRTSSLHRRRIAAFRDLLAGRHRERATCSAGAHSSLRRSRRSAFTALPDAADVPRLRRPGRRDAANTRSRGDRLRAGRSAGAA